jgi:hypothetical protein
MDLFDALCDAVPFEETSKLEQAKIFLWFHCRSEGVEEADISTISRYFERALLPKPNSTRLREDFVADRGVVRGSRAGLYRLTRATTQAIGAMYSYVFVTPQSVEVHVSANVRETPFLTAADIDAAFKMGELYVVMHCYENSVRQLIQQVLSGHLGSEWWEKAANASMKGKVKSRKEVEARNRWMSPRGNTALYYLDWGELVALMRKYEETFNPFIRDIKFVELRFEELEKLRNIVAHNGVLPHEEDFQFAVLSFRHWSRQVKLP